MSENTAVALMLTISISLLILTWRLIDINRPTKPSYDIDRYEYSKICVESRGWPEVSSDHTHNWHCHEVHWKINRE